jgi:hypothetical protein
VWICLFMFVSSLKDLQQIFIARIRANYVAREPV